MLIEDFKKAYRLWSIRFGALSAFFCSLALALQEGWGAVPDVIKNNIPPEIVQKAALILAILTVVARVLKQNDTDKT